MHSQSVRPVSVKSCDVRDLEARLEPVKDQPPWNCSARPLSALRSENTAGTLELLVNLAVPASSVQEVIYRPRYDL